MTQSGSHFHSREQPEASGLSATLHHVSGWPVLSITGSPQTMELEITNRTPHPVVAGPAQVRLMFRHGTLTDLEHLALAPQSEAQWALSLHDEPKDGNTVLAFAGVETFTLAPGESTAIRIDGISAAADGGSRATRVEFDYKSFFHEDHTEIAGARLLHLSVLRRHEPVGLPATEIRTGSVAKSGPFEAGFRLGSDVLNDGKSSNRLSIRILNASGLPIRLSSNGDEATRFHLAFETGSVEAEWGLLGSDSDHISIEVPDQDWKVDNHTITRDGAGSWPPRGYFDIDLDIHTKALAGEAQLVLTYENLPAHDDGDLVLLINLGPTAFRDDKLTVNGELDVDGVVRSSANHIDTARESFTLGGDLDVFYPVVFYDLGWSKGEFRFEVFRPYTHEGPHRYRGSLMAKIACHSDGWGHGSQFWSIEARQMGSSAGIERKWHRGNSDRRFIGGFQNHSHGSYHVLWLAGQTTYHWVANHPSRIINLDELSAPGPTTVGRGGAEKSFGIKTEPDDGFDAPYFSLKESLGADTSPVPRGAIMMWSGTAGTIPMGWALCNGDNGTPDLQGRFIVGHGSGNYNNATAREPAEAFNFPVEKQGGRLHVSLTEPQMPNHLHAGETHYNRGQTVTVPIDKATFKSVTTHGGIGASTTFSAMKTHHTGFEVRGASDHRHTFYTDRRGQGVPHENLPPYFALCFIMKL